MSYWGRGRDIRRSIPFVIGNSQFSVDNWSYNSAVIPALTPDLQNVHTVKLVNTFKPASAATDFHRSWHIYNHEDSSLHFCILSVLLHSPL